MSLYTVKVKLCTTDHCVHCDKITLSFKSSDATPVCVDALGWSACWTDSLKGTECAACLKDLMGACLSEEKSSANVNALTYRCTRQVAAAELKHWLVLTANAAATPLTRAKRITRQTVNTEELGGDRWRNGQMGNKERWVDGWIGQRRRERERWTEEVLMGGGSKQGRKQEVEWIEEVKC